MSYLLLVGSFVAIGRGIFVQQAASEWREDITGSPAKLELFSKVSKHLLAAGSLRSDQEKQSHSWSSTHRLRYFKQQKKTHAVSSLDEPSITSNDSDLNHCQTVDPGTNNNQRLNFAFFYFHSTLVSCLKKPMQWQNLKKWLKKI